MKVEDKHHALQLLFLKKRKKKRATEQEFPGVYTKIKQRNNENKVLQSIIRHSLSRRVNKQ